MYKQYLDLNLVLHHPSSWLCNIQWQVSYLGRSVIDWLLAMPYHSIYFVSPISQCNHFIIISHLSSSISIIDTSSTSIGVPVSSASISSILFISIIHFCRVFYAIYFHHFHIHWNFFFLQFFFPYHKLFPCHQSCADSEILKHNTGWVKHFTRTWEETPSIMIDCTVQKNDTIIFRNFWESVR